MGEYLRYEFEMYVIRNLHLRISIFFLFTPHYFIWRPNNNRHVFHVPTNPLSNIASRPTDLFIVRKPIKNVGSSLIGTNFAHTERQTQFCTPRVTATLVSTCLYRAALYTCSICIEEQNVHKHTLLILHGNWR